MRYLKKILSPSILIFSLLIFIYTFYKSEIFWDGSKRSYYIIYYIISSLLFIFSLFTFFLNDKNKEYIIIIFLSFVFSVYIFEGYITFKNKFPKNKFNKEQLYEKQSGKKWDKRSRKEIYKDLKKINKKITLSIGPANHINRNYSILPLAGISNSKTIVCNENGYYSIYKSDRFGFNNPDNEWDKKKVEYLLVGDSFTHGACVDRPHDMGSALRKLSKKSVLNLGQGWNGPLIEYATLREYLDNNVRKVLWIYFEGNDFQDLENEIDSKILIKYLNDLSFNQDLKNKQIEIDKILKEYVENEKEKEFSKIYFFDFLKVSNLRILITSFLKSYSTSKFEEIIYLANDLVAKKNSKLYFVYLPTYYRYSLPYFKNEYNSVKKIVNKLGIPFIDIHKEVFENEKNPLNLFPFGQFGHYNIEGYKKISNVIYELTKN